MTFQALLFDQGNTLLEYSLQGRWPEFRHKRLAEMCPLVCEQSPGLRILPNEFADRVGEVIGKRGAEIEKQGLSWHFAERLAKGLEAVGASVSTEILDRLADFFYQPVRACTRPYPETAEVLEALKARGLKLAVVTNAPWDSPTRLVRGDLQRWGLAACFDAYICSGEVPWRKPNPAFMHAAAEALDAEPAACLVIGDSPTHDILGARNAGMPAAWLNRNSEPLAEGIPRPDWEIRSLSELEGIVSR